jgi:predicted transcriptional regulator
MRRTQYDIVFNILEFCLKNQKLTNIIHKCTLSWPQTKKYLIKINHYGLLEKQGKFYKTTEKGRIFLTKYKEVLAELEKQAPSP